MGTFDADRDPETVAMFIQCGLLGLAVLTKTGPDPSLVDAVIDELIGVLDQQPADNSPTVSDRRTPDYR